MAFGSEDENFPDPRCGTWGTLILFGYGTWAIRHTVKSPTPNANLSEQILPHQEHRSHNRCEYDATPIIQRNDHFRCLGKHPPPKRRIEKTRSPRNLF
jgi:hypothetical protein